MGDMDFAKPQSLTPYRDRTGKFALPPIDGLAGLGLFAFVRAIDTSNSERRLWHVEANSSLTHALGGADNAAVLSLNQKEIFRC